MTAKKISQNKTYIFLLVGYMITQFLWPLSELFFIASIVVAAIWISKNYKLNKNYSPILYSTLLCFLANLILTLIYIPLLILNPDINWSLQDGRDESDPMILLAYFPTINLILFIVVILITLLTIKVADMESSESA